MLKHCNKEGNKNMKYRVQKSTNKSTQAKTEAKPSTTAENRTHIEKKDKIEKIHLSPMQTSPLWKASSNSIVNPALLLTGNFWASSPKANF